MNLNKKILAAAIVGGLFATTAQAQVDLSAAPTASTNPTLYASEIIAGTGSAAVPLTAIPQNQITAQTGYAFSNAEVRYARFECSPNYRFSLGTAVPTVTGVAAGGVGNVNGDGTNVINFSITAPAVGIPNTATITVPGARSITSASDVTCSYSLYDTPSQAANGGSAGLITTTGPRPAATFVSSIVARVSNTDRVASVTASPSFSAFVDPAGSTASIARVWFGLRSVAGLAPNNVQPRIADGTVPTDLATFIGTGVLPAATSGTNHVVTGDFSLAASTGATPFNADARARVFFATNSDCTGSVTGATALTATTATFTIGATPVTGLYLCLTRNAPNLIASSTYSFQANPVSAAPTLYSVSPIGPVALGSITRNGTQLQAPLAQIPAGWLSRVVLTNTGSVARSYTITAQTEAGVTATLGSAATGTIPANGTIVLNTSDIVTFAGAAPRGTLNASIAAPGTQVQGLYQIVNPASGSISNHVMVRPDSN